MVKNEFRYILRRVIIGVSIGIIIWFLKTNVFAMSCGMVDYDYFTAFDEPGVLNATAYTSNANNTANINFVFTEPYYTINFNDDYDYYVITIPYNLSANYQSNTNTIVQTTNLENMAVLFGRPNQTNLTGYHENGLLKLRIKETTILRAVWLRVPNFYYNFGVTGVNANIWGYWTIEKYKCSDSTSAIEENTQAVQETNDTLKDDSVDNDKASSDIEDMQSKTASNGTITQLITLPVTLYQSILNSISGSCSTWNLGSLLGHNLTLPCINLSNYIGSALYNIIDILISGLFILSFRKKMVDIFNHMTSLNDRGNEVE